MRKRLCAVVMVFAGLLGVAACMSTSSGSVRIERNFAVSGASSPTVSAIPVSDLAVAKGRVAVQIGYGQYDLETLTVTPPGPGPFPLAVISHGVGNKTARKNLSLRRYLAIAEDFARRGYKSVVFARRGFASSSGSYQEGYSSKDATGLSFALAARNGGKDYAAVIETFAKRPEVDGSTVVVVGQSGGGFAASALASSPPPGLVGIVNFAGGRGGIKRGGRWIRGNRNEEGFVRAFGRFGEEATVPALWLYSTTDRLFWPELVDRAFEAYAAGGAPVRLERVGHLGFTDNGHLLYLRDGRRIWRPRIDAFLDAIGAPNWNRTR